MNGHRIQVLVVGAGSPNPDFLAETLRLNGVDAERTANIAIPNPFLIRRFDIVYGIYLQSCSRYIVVAKLLRKKTVIHFVGSDAYWFARERSIIRRLFWTIVLRLTDFIFYVSPHLEALTGRRGTILPLPVATDLFREAGLRLHKPDRDVLYYCPSGKDNERIYRLPWILEYAASHPEERVTILGNSSHPAQYKLDLPNVLVVPFVESSEMPDFYRKHKRLIRMTTEDGLPQMIHEAVLAGLEVDFNGEKIQGVPKERERSYFASTFKTTLGIGAEGHPRS
jgi:hypothetical protein